MEETEEADFTLIMGDKRIECSKHFLARHSDYFDAMFRSQMKESLSCSVELKDISFANMDFLLSFTRDKEIEIAFDTALTILPLASMYQFRDCINKCSTVLLSNITPLNCLQLMRIAYNCGLKTLYARSMQYALWYFEQIRNVDSFFNLDIKHLTEYISNVALRVKNELLVFEAVEKWINHDYITREKHFCELFKCLRLSKLNEGDIVKISATPHMESCLQCQRIVTDGKTRDQSKREFPTKLLVVCGVLLNEDVDEKIPNPQLDVYQEATKTLEKCLPIPGLDAAQQQGCLGCVAAVVGKSLYITGGEVRLGRGCFRFDVYCYDLLDGEWRLATRLQQARRHHSVCVAGDQLYLLGGFGKHRLLLDSVEGYNTTTGEWTSMPNLLNADYSAAATVCQGKIFYIKHNIQCFDMLLNSWSYINVDLPFRNGFLSALSVGSKIYLTGQYVLDLIELNTDLESFTILGKFSETSGPSCLFKNCLYVVCGENSKKIERFNFDTKTFETVSELEYCRINHSCVVVPNFEGVIL